ncbi:MAG: PEP-CTERM sorting domain-containing protein [Tepidisphaeraceae bacterium]
MRRKTAILAAASISGLGLSAGAFASVTGPFTGPVTTNLVLSVDLNGGKTGGTYPGSFSYSDGSATEGNTGNAPVGADQYGVTWSPWAGPFYYGGDGTHAFPDSNGQASGLAGLTSLSDTFGGITATLSAPGLSANYASGEPINSRDRGSLGGLSNNPTSSTGGNAYDANLLSTLVFGAVSGTNIQGTNMLQLTVSGLSPNTAYLFAGFSDDLASGHTENWTAIAPTVDPSHGLGWWAAGNGSLFQAPADEQTITWTTASMANRETSATTAGAPALLGVTTDGTGTFSVWTFGGDGISGDQSSTNSYINAFQIAAVPEPATLGLVGMASLGLLARRRRA